MVTVTELRGTEDYAVETPAGAIGRVEAVQQGALAVLTNDGDHLFLPDADILTVDREHHWVVVGEHPALLTPTGEVVHPEPLDRLADFREFVHRHAPDLAGRPLWQLVTILYAVVTLIVLAGVGLVFLVAWLATGAPY
jgi:hypothetical protein